MRRSADLRGADLPGVCNIVMANLKRASFDSETTCPAGLDPTALGAVATKARRNR